MEQIVDSFSKSFVAKIQSDNFIDSFFELTKQLVSSPIEKYFLKELAKQKLLLSYFKGNLEKAPQIAEISAHIEEILAHNPNEILGFSLSEYASFLTSFESHFNTYKKEIESDLLGNTITDILNISLIANGHAESFGSITVTSSAGNFLYYGNDIPKISHISSILNRFFPNQIRIPKCIEKKDCLFIEKPVDKLKISPNRCRDFAFKTGELCCLFLLLGLRSGFEENVGFDGKDFYIKDFSLLFTKPDSKDSYLTHSLISTDLLSHFDDTTQKSLLLSTYEGNPFSPDINGALFNLMDYEEDFLRGFSSCYKYCISVREKLLDSLNKDYCPAVISQLNYFSDDSLECEFSLLRLSGKKRDVFFKSKKMSTAKEPLPPVTEAECIKEAEKLYRKVMEESVLTPEGYLGFISPTYRPNVYMALDNLSFVSGQSGILNFTTALLRFSKDPEIKKSCIFTSIKILDQIVSSDLNANKPGAISLSAGFSGMLAGLLKVKSFSDNDEIITKASELIKKIVPVILKSDLTREPTDYFTGSAGALKILCTYDELFSLPGVSSFCAKVGELLLQQKNLKYENRLFWNSLGSKRPLSGMAHGQCGIASALYVAGTRLNRTDFLSAADDAYEYEDEVYLADKKAWPDFRPIAKDAPSATMHGYCSGAPGIGFDMLGKESPLFTRILDRAISATLSQGIFDRNHLCCGNSASVDFLIEAGVRLSRPDLIKEARILLANMYAKAMEKGSYNLINPMARASLYYGYSGIGYECLRAAFPNNLPTMLI